MFNAEEAHISKAEWLGEDASSFSFRPIHYLGSKLRVLAAIEQAIDDVDPSRGPVCDLFSGSATVSRYLSKHRRVMAVDIQEYARVLADAVLNGSKAEFMPLVEEELRDESYGSALRWAVEPLVKLESKVTLCALQGDIEPLCTFLELGNLVSLEGENVLPASSPLGDATRETQARIRSLELSGAESVCVRHFGGQYFSYAQAADLDSIAGVARRSQSSVLMAATLSTASHLVNSVGKQFAQPIRPRDKAGVPKRHLVKKVISERGLSARSVFMNYLRQYKELTITRRQHVSIRADFQDALAKPAIKPSVVYADPPYTRDHYSRFYHTLETIALGDDPSITRSNLGRGISSRGAYRAGRHQSPFCIKSQAPEAFSALFNGVAALKVPLILSYSGYDSSKEARPRVMSLDAIVKLAKKHFENVQVQELTSLAHMKLNTTSLNKAAKGTTEILLLCRQ